MSAALCRIIDLFASKRVLVVGDAMLDSYVVGMSTRLCQEAPVPVVAVRERRDCPGGAANTAVNLAALGCQVDLLTVVGADHEGYRLRDLLRQYGVSTSLLTISEARQTLSKQRIVNGDRLLARVDQGDTGPIPAHVEWRLLSRLEAAFVRADAVVISDYAYGVMTARMITRVRTLQARFRQLIAVDARDLWQYQRVGVTLVKPNFAEAVQLTRRSPAPAGASRVDVALGLGQAVLARSGAQIAAITLDADGAIVVERGRQPYRTVAVPVDHVNTVGAGDTYLAALTLALASGAATPEAAQIAACAADVVVGRDGTAACTDWDVRRKIAWSEAAAALPVVGVWPDSTSAQHMTSEERDAPDDPTAMGECQASALHQA
ncbi:MAG: bifunctional heptose 7-phosphate kinase/heptose 1-phosphate adenyltransferase [Chloroflexota bacterium]